ncbi:hypothetical protein AIA08_004327 [Salmonella enterica subsp. enterica serovar Wichita]|nr:hypothetical protein [Salmonella enterica subsp. salamae]EGZ3996487.1 hypothetical protein [Salmonella enterica subsp. enterica serovar Wichita]
MFTASTRSSYMSIKRDFLNMLPGYAYGIDTFWLCVDEIGFFKHVVWICLPHRHVPAICR